MVHIWLAKISAWANVINFMVFSQKVSVIYQHPLHIKVICLEIWKVKKISKNLVPSKSSNDLYTPSIIHCQNTLSKFYLMKNYLVTTLVHKNSFRSLVSTTDFVFLCRIQRYFWKFSTTIIKDFYTNKVNYVKQKIRKTKIPRSFASSTVRLYKLSQKLWNILISFAQLTKNISTKRSYPI